MRYGDEASPSIVLASLALLVKMLITLELCGSFGLKFALLMYFNIVQPLVIIIKIIIIISIFKEDNVLSMNASLPYGPPMNTDIDHYRTSFLGLFYCCKCCDVRCAIIVRRTLTSQTVTKLHLASFGRSSSFNE